MLLLTAFSSWADELSRQAPVLGAVSHQVREDESWESVATQYGVLPQRLRELNQGVSLRAGEEIWIPPAANGWPRHTVLRGQTLWRIGKGYGIPVQQLKQANGLSGSGLMPGDVLVLPRGEAPQWALEEKVSPTMGSRASQPSRELSSRSGKIGVLAPKSTEVQGWVEVQLPDDRKAWVKAESLVLGSWEPQGPEDLIETARRFVGVPYRWGGTDPNGYDCSGFVQEVFRLSGHRVPRMADVQYQELVGVERGDLKAGDLVFFNTDGSGVSHVGIYVGDESFLHASSSRGVIESSLQQDYYRTRFVGAARLPAWE